MIFSVSRVSIMAVKSMVRVSLIHSSVFIGTVMATKLVV